MGPCCIVKGKGRLCLVSVPGGLEPGIFGKPSLAVENSFLTLVSVQFSSCCGWDLDAAKGVKVNE